MNQIREDETRISNDTKGRDSSVLGSFQAFKKGAGLRLVVGGFA